MLLRGAIIGAADLHFSCFFGTETEPDCETIFRARGDYTSSPHIVLIWICMGAAEQDVLLGSARAVIRAPIMLLRGAIIAAADLRFS